MFVRWKKRIIYFRKKPTEDYYLTAALLKSFRTKSGKPRQYMVSYLGSIPSNKTGLYWFQFDFWKSVTEHLDKLRLGPEEREKIESKLKSVVPLPNQEQKEKDYEAFKAQFGEKYANHVWQK